MKKSYACKAALQLSGGGFNYKETIDILKQNSPEKRMWIYMKKIKSKRFERKISEIGYRISEVRPGWNGLKNMGTIYEVVFERLYRC